MRSAASFRSCARTVSTSSAIIRSLSSPMTVIIAPAWELLVAERIEVVAFCAGKQIEERVQAPIERTAELRDRAVEGVQGDGRGRSIRELQRRAADVGQRPFRNESDSIDEGVSGHT